MKVVDILILLFKNDKGVTKERIAKAQGLAARSGIAWDAVTSAMSAEERKMVDDALAA